MQPVVQQLVADMNPGSFPVVETWGNPVLMVEFVQPLPLVADLVLASLHY